MIGQSEAIGIRRRASIQRDQHRQPSHGDYLIRTGLSDWPKIIGVFAGADIHPPRVKASAPVKIEFAGSRLKIGITGVDTGRGILKMIIVIWEINELRVRGNVTVSPVPRHAGPVISTCV